jgi:hypothetical protein
MASNLAKRLARLEELLAARLNTPVALLWLGEGQDPGALTDELVASGQIGAADRPRVRFVRWQTEAESAKAEIWRADDEKKTGLEPGPGPLAEVHVGIADHGSHETSGSPVELAAPLETEDQYRERLKREERRLVNEKIEEAAIRYARSIV